MNKFFLNYLIFAISLSILVGYKSLDYDFLKEESKPKKQDNSDNKKKSKKDTFAELTKGFNKIDGLLDFYWDKEINKCYIAISPNQLNQIFLLSLTRQTGDGYRYDGSSMLGEFPISFNKMGNNIQIIRENMKFRAQKDSAISKAIDNNITKSIFSTAKIEAISNKDSLFLIDASNFFMFDFPKISNRGKYIFDKKNSSFDVIQSFDFNT